MTQVLLVLGGMLFGFGLASVLCSVRRGDD